MMTMPITVSRLICVMHEGQMVLSEVDAEDVTVPGFEQYRFFIHATPGTEDADDLWNVSEASTGYAVSQKAWGKEGALIAAQMVLEGWVAQGKTIEAVQEAVWKQQRPELREKLEAQTVRRSVDA